jgi:prepilin-type processing-associated H-X9-DG protein
MATPTASEGLFDPGSAPPSTIHVSQRCCVRVQEGHWLVLGSGIPLLHFAEGDAMARAHAIVSVVQQGWATQVEVARAFDVTTRTVRRLVDRFVTGGLCALGRRGGYPAGRLRRPAARLRLIESLKKRGGLSNRRIAERVGMDEKAVRKALRQLGWDPKPHPQLAFEQAAAEPEAPAPAADPNLSAFRADPNLSASDEDPLPVTFDRDPCDRRMDRLFAYLGLLDDAAPLFCPGSRVPRAGVLLAVPSLLATGVLACARQIYGNIGPAFYGLRTSVVAFCLMALLRIKRPEAIKEHSPQDLGRILGLDRAPEVKTLRRKLERLARAGRAAQFGRLLAERRVAAHGAATGFLYVDGHVRVYHGLHDIPYAHVARMRLSRPATSDYWVNDATGEPVFVVTAEANAGLAKMLPLLLEEIRRLVGERRVTVVFDRGGWSPALFKQILDRGFDFLTYRKGASRHVAKRLFRTASQTVEGKKVSYTLADRGIRLLGGSLHLRQVTRLSDSGHQTPIVTSRRDLSAVQVAYHMFERWRQENFFKYLRQEYELDALLEYAVEKADPTREVPNPAWTALTAAIRAAREEAKRACALYGIDLLDNPAKVRRTVRGYKIAHSKDGKAVQQALERVARLVARRARVPNRVPVKDVVEGPVLKLAPERQHIGNIFKMVAYQAESDLVRRIAPHYRRAEQEGRTLVATALTSAADIALTDTELRVTLAPLSSPHRTRAVAALCAELDREPVRFPGTRLRMRFDVRASLKADKSTGG